MTDFAPLIVGATAGLIGYAIGCAHAREQWRQDLASARTDMLRWRESYRTLANRYQKLCDFRDDPDPPEE